MAKYLISFPGPAMDIPAEDMTAVSEAAHAVIRDAKDEKKKGGILKLQRRINSRTSSASKDIPSMLTWDRSHDYVLQRFWHDLTRVTIRFHSAPASVHELVALRRCLPQFRDVAPAALRRQIGDSQELSLGEMPTPEARRVIDAVKAQGLEVVAESASFVSYLPYDRTTGCAWLIEDDAEAAAVAQAMLREGVPVQDVEA